jgi:hypothetical protein
LNSSNTNSAKFEKVTKRVAKSNCFNRTEDIDESTNNNIPGFVNVKNRDQGTRSYSCKLE